MSGSPWGSSSEKSVTLNPTSLPARLVEHVSEPRRDDAPAVRVVAVLGAPELDARQVVVLGVVREMQAERGHGD